MRIALPLDAQIRAKASSSFTQETIAARLTALADMEQTEKVKNEIAYLELLNERCFGKAAE